MESLMSVVDEISNNLDTVIHSFTKEDNKVVFEDNLDKLHRFHNPAPNIIEWATRPEYLNFIIEEEDTDATKTIYEHFGQYQTLRDFFELLCPICSCPEDKDCWGKSRESLESQPLLIWNTEYKDDECPRCKTTRQEFNESGLFSSYNTLLLIVGMRSSKSTVAALIATWLEHKLLTLHSPQKFFGQVPRQLFEVSFVATTAKQGEKTVYEYFRGLRETSPWIQQYMKTLKNLEQYKKQYYEETGSTVKYNNINILFESLTSNSSGIAGGTRIGFFVDELSRFDTTESKRSAKEIYRVGSQGLKTIRSVRLRKTTPNCYGNIIATTSPISITDYAMKLSEKAPKTKNMYFVHKPTWEYNPNEPFENFKEDFDLDPVGARRDFGAMPPNAESPLISDVEKFKSCIDISLKPTATFVSTYTKDPLGREYVGKALEFCQIDYKNKKVIVGDAGKDRDSFALVCAHGEWEIGEGGRKWVTIYDWVLSVRPTMNPKRTVSFDSAETVIKNIAEKQKIAMVRFDKWNSESIIQSLRFKGIDADILSIKTEQYFNFVQDINEGKVKFIASKEDDAGKDPYKDMSDEGRAIHELLHLEKSIDLKKVDHKEGEHNDIAVCIVGCHYLIQNTLRNVGATNSKTMPNNTMQYSTGTIGKFRRW